MHCRGVRPLAVASAVRCVLLALPAARASRRCSWCPCRAAAREGVCDSRGAYAHAHAHQQKMLRAATSPAAALTRAGSWPALCLAKGVGSAAAGPFLNALAAGRDAQSNLPRSPRKLIIDPVMGAYGSASHTLAMELRFSLCGQLGPEVTCAALRAATRHGRLHPGPPQLGPPAQITNSELKQVTRSEDVPKEVVRLLSSVQAPPS